MSVPPQEIRELWNNLIIEMDSVMLPTRERPQPLAAVSDGMKGISRLGSYSQLLHYDYPQI